MLDSVQAVIHADKRMHAKSDVPTGCWSTVCTCSPTSKNCNRGTTSHKNICFARRVGDGWKMILTNLLNAVRTCRNTSLGFLQSLRQTRPRIRRCRQRMRERWHLVGRVVRCRRCGAKLWLGWTHGCDLRQAERNEEKLRIRVERASIKFKRTARSVLQLSVGTEMRAAHTSVQCPRSCLGGHLLHMSVEKIRSYTECCTRGWNHYTAHTY